MAALSIRTGSSLNYRVVCGGQRHEGGDTMNPEISKALHKRLCNARRVKKKFLRRLYK